MGAHARVVRAAGPRRTVSGSPPGWAVSTIMVVQAASRAGSPSTSRSSKESRWPLLQRPATRWSWSTCSATSARGAAWPSPRATRPSPPSTRSPHPSSFPQPGGPWPTHCVEGTPGWDAHPDLKIEAHHQVFKGRERELDGYTGWSAELADFLARRGTTRVVVVGLALDYCVQATALDARAAGHEVVVLTDATRAVNVKPDDGERALDGLRAAGVREGRAEG